MVGLPTSDWGPPSDPAPPAAADWRDAGAIDHVFTHFALTLQVRAGEGEGDFLWTPPEAARAALPTVFRKALERGLAA
jgi:A/G-specific adenine glycosylase